MNDRAGIKRVVAGMVDPDPRVSGLGLEFLKSNNISTSIINGTLQNACQQLNAPFVHRVTHGRPFIVTWNHFETNTDTPNNLSRCSNDINTFASLGSVEICSYVF